MKERISLNFEFAIETLVGLGFKPTDAQIYIFLAKKGPKKGKDFKKKNIQRIIDHSPDKKFILMGDDTQQDMHVYAEIASIYPTRIFKIYIRKTRRQLLGNRQEQLNKLKQSGVPFMYFSDEDAVEKEIKSIDKLINKP